MVFSNEWAYLDPPKITKKEYFHLLIVIGTACKSCCSDGSYTGGIEFRDSWKKEREKELSIEVSRERGHIVLTFLLAAIKNELAWKKRGGLLQNAPCSHAAPSPGIQLPFVSSSKAQIFERYIPHCVHWVFSMARGRFKGGRRGGVQNLWVECHTNLWCPVTRPDFVKMISFVETEAQRQILLESFWCNWYFLRIEKMNIAIQ